MTKTFKPMLAKDMVPAKLKFPVAVQAKIDGIRCVIKDGKALTRTLKEVPNREIFEYLSRPEFEGLDGELVVGSPTADDCYNTTVRYVMTPTKKTGQEWTYYVFDKHDHPGTFSERYEELSEPGFISDLRIATLTSNVANDMGELKDLEAAYVDLGYEGIIVRNPDALYKYGRSTVTVGESMKVKSYKDAEAKIIGVEEELHNANEAKTNALGRTERSSHKANKVGKGTLGALIVRDLKTGVEFKVGTGFTAQMRKEMWQDHIFGHPLSDRIKPLIVGKTIKYKYFDVGVKDKPRHPVFLGFRDMELDG